MKRTNVYLSEKQLERLWFRAKQEEVAIAELVLCAIDTFLAWDDPTYLPHRGPNQGTAFPPSV